MLPSHRLTAALILAGAAVPMPAFGQAGMVQALPGEAAPTGDADRLAAAVRRLGSDPRDLPALVEAGELSIRLGDATAAAAFFKRAETIDPSNGRVKAGIARILVNGEHPGEALRYFADAERFGVAPAAYADDRGLAFDLVGEQERAQRDYRLALARGIGEADEVRRRYALSLGISGKTEPALAEIDALVRQSDRGAWRARAFILAMSGDVAGANRIAGTMMPPGMASGLGAFFGRLPALSPADRAFAVHFGEVTTTPARIADARLTPALPPLGADSGIARAPVQVAAAAAPVVASAPTSRRDRRRRGREAAPPVAVAVAPGTAGPPAATLAMVQPLPPSTKSAAAVRGEARSVGASPVASRPLVANAVAPAVGASGVSAPPTPNVGAIASAGSVAISAQRPVLTAVPAAASIPVATQRPLAGGAVVASSTAALPSPTAVAATPTPAPVSARPPGEAVVATTIAPAPRVDGQTATASAPSIRAPLAGVAPVSPAGGIAPVSTPPADVAAAAPSGQGQPATTPPLPTTAPAVATSASAAPVAVPVALAATPGRGTAPSPVRRIAPARMSEDSILARIVAGISIPAAELEVAPMPLPVPLVNAPPPTAASGAASVARLRAVAQAAERNGAATRETAVSAPQRAAVRSASRVAARLTAEDAAEAPSRDIGARRRGTAPREAAPDDGARSSRGARDLAAKDTAKAASRTRGGTAVAAAAPATKRGTRSGADKESAAEGKGDPARIWVQVAGGANEGDLAKAWKGAQAKAPALKARQGFATPSRATNRVVTGPFKTEAEARAVVNQLSKQGVSAFTFTSTKGQKVTRLEPK